VKILGGRKLGRKSSLPWGTVKRSRSSDRKKGGDSTPILIEGNRLCWGYFAVEMKREGWCMKIPKKSIVYG